MVIENPPELIGACSMPGSDNDIEGSSTSSIAKYFWILETTSLFKMFH